MDAKRSTVSVGSGESYAVKSVGAMIVTIKGVPAIKNSSFKIE
jgi:hypothetical protein